MTNEECPKCGSDDLDMMDTDNNDDRIVAEMTCLKCDYVWRAEYQLARLLDFYTGEMIG